MTELTNFEFFITNALSTTHADLAVETPQIPLLLGGCMIRPVEDFQMQMCKGVRMQENIAPEFRLAVWAGMSSAAYLA
jgi:hypothetical protein